MSLLRDLPVTVNVLEERTFITCSVPIAPTTAGGAGGVGAPSTAQWIVSSCCGSTGGYIGRVIDRRADIFPTSPRFQIAVPTAEIYSSRGSTEANRNITLQILLTHGDSSGGGDQVVFSTGTGSVAPVGAQMFFGTARTSDMQVWDSANSTGALWGSTLPAVYDLRAAKRYVSALIWAVKNRVTTESSGDEGARVRASITFAAADEASQVVGSTGTWFSTQAWSTSTST